MNVVIVCFEDFTDLDVFLPWDLLTRVVRPDWSVRLVGTAQEHTSRGALRVAMHGTLDEIESADAVLFSSGRGVHRVLADPAFVESMSVNPERQLVGSICSGAFVLADLGLLDGLTATTHATRQEQLRARGIEVVDSPFVVHGNIATAGGCLAGQFLAGWVLERLLGTAVADEVTSSIQPVGVEPLGGVRQGRA